MSDDMVTASSAPDLLRRIDAWCNDDDTTPVIEFICETIRPAVAALAESNDVACDDAMRLLEQIATIIDGPIADIRLHDWSGLPERVRLRMRELNSWRVDSGLEPLPAPPDAKETP